MTWRPSSTPATCWSTWKSNKVTTFCAPPTMFRFMLQEDVTKYDLSSIPTAASPGSP